MSAPTGANHRNPKDTAGGHHANAVQSLDGRLARRPGQASQERVQNPRQSRGLPEGTTRSSKKSAPPDRLGPIVAAWLAGCQKGTHAAVAAQALLEKSAKLRISELNATIPAAIVADWRLKYSQSTVAIRRRELARLLGFLIEHGANRELRRQLPKAPYPGPRTVIASDAEIEKLIATAKPWMRLWLTLTAGHGLRFHEAQRLRLADYNAQSNTFTHRTKGNQTNTLPASDELKAFIDSLPKDTDRNTPLVDIAAGRHMTRANIYAKWERLKKHAGVNRFLRTHDLRRTLAVKVYELTHDLRAVQQTLGHTRLATTCLYLEHHDPEKIRPILNQLRPKPSWSH